MTALVLGVLALALTGPVPALLARASWPHRVPRAAATLWQAIAAAAVLAALGAGLAVALDILVHPATTAWTVALRVGALVLTMLVATRLAWSATRLALRVRRARRRHRDVVDLLATGLDGQSEVRVLQHPSPVAYCLPGLRSRVVLSAGTLSTLDQTEITAVLAHERAHLRARHDLVIEAFTALHSAFPRVVRSRTALDQVRLLAELLADDAARRRAGSRPLATALVQLAGSHAPDVALAAAGTATVLRVRRLGERPAPRPLLAAATYLTAALLVALPTVAVAVPWLASLNHALT